MELIIVFGGLILLGYIIYKVMDMWGLNDD